MAPVDGTPGVFAVVVHLPPGCVTADLADADADMGARDGRLLMLLVMRACVGGAPQLQPWQWQQQSCAVVPGAYP